MPGNPKHFLGGKKWNKKYTNDTKINKQQEIIKMNTL